MSTSIGYFDAFMQDLIRAKHVYYSEECFSYYLEEDRFLIQDLHNVKNKWGERIKCTLIRHRDPENSLCDAAGMNAKCIVYLHGFGSCRLESLNLLPFLPKNYCLCMFDLSGSGKSQGQFMTYGLKESEDIEPVISQLMNKKGIEEFVLWGRSMGAVAALLYAIENHPCIARKSPLVRRNHHDSLRNSRNQSREDERTGNKLVKAIIMDSPFHNFREVAKQISISRLSIPALFVDFAMKYVEQSFAQILRDAVGEQYSPFHICFNKQISLSIPVIILSSQKDEVVASNHSERIAKLITTKFQKIPINQCSHNQPRPERIVKSIVQKLDKYLKTQSTITKYSSISICSSQRKRGIFVFTPSKQKQCRTDSPKKSYYDFKFQISPQQSPKNNPSMPNERNSKSLKKYKIFLECSRKTVKEPEKEVNFVTVDSQASNLINKKLIGIKQTQATNNYRLLRSRRVIERKKEIKCTAQSKFS